jgi:predicted nuclease of predicted toxin-antitoxin system
MNLFADESVERQIVDALRLDGHNVSSVAEMSPSISDDEVLHNANSLGAVLLTADKDFGELVFRLRRVHNGVILLRLPGLPTPEKVALVVQLCRGRAAELVGSFSVVTAGSIRIRHVS